jgi:hypothetical protein
MVRLGLNKTTGRKLINNAGELYVLQHFINGNLK